MNGWSADVVFTLIDGQKLAQLLPCRSFEVFCQNTRKFSNAHISRPFPTFWGVKSATPLTVSLRGIRSCGVVSRLTGPMEAILKWKSHTPAVCGSGAAAVEVHPPGTSCSTRPSSSHGWSHRPWSEFLRSYLTFCLGLTAAAESAAVSGGPSARAG